MIPVKYTVPKQLLKCEKGHLIRLRKHLEAIGYPLASNDELNAPDSVLRLADGFTLVDVHKHESHNSYFVARTEC